MLLQKRKELGQKQINFMQFEPTVFPLRRTERRQFVSVILDKIFLHLKLH